MKLFLATCGLGLLLYATGGTSGILWLLFLAVLAVLVTRLSAGARSTAGAVPFDRGAGRGDADAAGHEARHKNVAEVLGGRGVSAWLTKDGGGWTRVRSWPAGLTDTEYIAYLWAGGLDNRRACSGDDAQIRDALRKVPAADRARVRRDAHRLARRTVSRRRGRIRRDTNTLLKEGRLG